MQDIKIARYYDVIKNARYFKKLAIVQVTLKVAEGHRN